MKKLLLAFAACAVSVCGLAADYTVTDLSTLADTFFVEGDTVTMPAGSWDVQGGDIANADGNVITCLKAGITLVREASNTGTTYRFNVRPEPKNGGDVFYLQFTANQNWTTAAWVKLTDNSERTYPDNSEDVAIIYHDRQSYLRVTNDADIRLHGLVQAMATKYGIDVGQGGHTLTFCGSEDNPAWWRFSNPHMADKGGDFRMGSESGSANGLVVVLDSPVLEVRGGNGAAGTWKAQNPKVQFAHVRFFVDEGQTLVFTKSGCELSVKNADGHISGTGTLRMAVSLPSMDILNYSGDVFAGSYELNADMEWKKAWTYKDIGLRVVGGSKDMARPTTLAVGYNDQYRGSNPNPGVNMIQSDNVYLNGACYKCFCGNDNSNEAKDRWTNGVDIVDGDLTPWYDAITQLNHFKKLQIEGSAIMMAMQSHDDWRPRTVAIFDEIEQVTGSDTLSFRGFSFRNALPFDPKQMRGKVEGAAFDNITFGRDARDGEDPSRVYKMVPWMICQYNDNSHQMWELFGTGNEYVAHNIFPGVYGRVLRLPETSFHNSDNNIPGDFALSKALPDDNVIFQARKNIGLFEDDVTINSLAYNCDAGTDNPWCISIGKGKKLTITSGGLIMARRGRWFGSLYTKGAFTPSGRSEAYTPEQSGAIEFGARAYVWSEHGRPDDNQTGNSYHEWNSIFAECVAKYGFVKAGLGDLVIARDQTGIEKDIVVNGGMLWLGHPYKYRKNGYAWGEYQGHPERFARDYGAATVVPEIKVRCGGTLGIPFKGYDIDGNGVIGDGETAISKQAVITLIDGGTVPSSLEIAEGADQTCQKLYISGRNKGKALKRGTYGATGSGADYIDDVHFAGTGVLTVRKDDAAGMYLIIR